MLLFIVEYIDKSANMCNKRPYLTVSNAQSKKPSLNLVEVMIQMSLLISLLLLESSFIFS